MPLGLLADRTSRTRLMALAEALRPAGLPVSIYRSLPRFWIVSSVLLSGLVLLNSQKGMGKLFEFIGSVSISAGLVAYLLSALAAIRLIPGDAVAIMLGANTEVTPEQTRLKNAQGELIYR